MPVVVEVVHRRVFLLLGDQVVTAVAEMVRHVRQVQMVRLELQTRVVAVVVEAHHRRKTWDLLAAAAL